MFDTELSVSELAGANDAVEAAIRADVSHPRPLYIEPDLLRRMNRQTKPETNHADVTHH